MNQPTNSHHRSERDEANLAANMIRQKISSLYENEPGAKAEALDAIESSGHRSKHQEFMHQLTTSGKSLAGIQTAWHAYYSDLPDNQKHEVWQEFYSAHQPAGQPIAEPKPAHHINAPRPITPGQDHPIKHTRHHRAPGQRSVDDIKHQILSKVRGHKKLKAREHFQSLIFGFGLGSFVLLIMLFGFFNERFVAPFITPSRHVTSTPIIIDPNNSAVDPQPKIIIPKINVEIPVVYDEPSIEENAVQRALERGVVHYATTPNPGEQGNTVIFGHSSNNIFNKGRYKFAFVLLSRLEAGDVFYLTKDGKRYAFRVYKKEVVKPDALGVLGNTDKLATVTLITCDPPGTSLNRLVVIGEQISPNPSANIASTALKSSLQPKLIPSNAPSLLQRFTDWLSR